MARSDFNFKWPFRVRYSEVDGQMIVFNAHYLIYFDTAITEYFRALPYDYMGQVKRTGEDYNTVKSVVNYHQPITFDEDIEVFVKVSRLGRSSLTFALEIHPQNTEDLRSTGEIIWVNTDQKSQKPVPLPNELVVKIKQFEGVPDVS